MMNELIFFLEITLITVAVLLSLKLGREALVTLCVGLSLFANLFVLKQMNLFGYAASCGDPFAVGMLLGLSLLRRKFGQSVAKKAIFMSFCILLFFACVSQLHLLYEPTPTDGTHLHFSAILNYVPLLFLGSLIAFFFAQKCDVGLYGWLEKFRGLTPSHSMIISLVVSQIVDTGLFTFLALYQAMEEVGSVFMVSCTVKIAVALMMSSCFILPDRMRVE